MDDLLRSLRNLGLKAPESSQLLELLDDDVQVQERLVKVLSLSSLEQDFEEAGGGAAALMGQDLLQEAVGALLDNFRKVVQRQQQAAKKEREGGVKRIKWPPRKALLARQTAALQRSERERAESVGYRPRLIFDGPDSFCSTSNLSQLKQMGCSDLNEAPKRYSGCYLLCRVITPLLLYAGVSFIIDDPSGAALPVSVSHFTSNYNLTTEQVSRLLPVGTIFAIREPFLSVDYQSRAGPCCGKADPGIRIDSPTDIIIGKDIDKGGIVWKEEMNEISTKETDWLRPNEGVGVNGCLTTTEMVQSEVERLLSIDSPGEAYRVMLKAKQNRLKLNKRTEGLVLFHLEEWEAAGKAFTQSPEETGGSDNNDEENEKAAFDFAVPISQLTSKQASIRCESRLSQARIGLSTIEMSSIFFAATKGVKRLETSNYIGPVAVRNIEGAGRGLVTTRAVEPGEMLLCCKAVCPAYPDDEECIGSPLIRLNLENSVVSTTSQVRAQTKLIHAIVDRPELALPILGLTAGPSIPNSKYVLQEYPLRTTSNLDGTVDSTKSDIDAAYVDGVLRFNAFGPAQSPSKERRVLSNSGELERSTMPHPLPAILNHACLPNVSSVFFSNIVTTRALTHLPKGTEIVHQYVKGEEPLAIRSANLSKHGFECGCRLCLLDRADGLENCQVRARITQGESRAVLDRSALLLKSVSLEQIVAGTELEEKNREAHDDIFESLQSLIDRIKATYSSKRGTFCPDLFIAMDARTKHVARTSIEEAISSAEEALNCVGAIIDLKNDKRVLVELPKLHFDPSIALILYIATLLAYNKSDSSSKAWVRSAFWAHECMVGGGIDVFLDRWDIIDYRPALTLWRSSL